MSRPVVAIFFRKMIVLYFPENLPVQLNYIAPLILCVVIL